MTQLFPSPACPLCTFVISGVWKQFFIAKIILYILKPNPFISSAQYKTAPLPVTLLSEPSVTGHVPSLTYCCFRCRKKGLGFSYFPTAISSLRTLRYISLSFLKFLLSHLEQYSSKCDSGTSTTPKLSVTDMKLVLEFKVSY